MKHFIHTGEFSRSELETLLHNAIANKGLRSNVLAGKSIGLLFFNSSLRTRSSFEVAIAQLGGHPVTLEVGSGVWNLEFREGAVMNADKSEHIKDAARVLSRYFDALCVRSFPGLKNLAEDMQDPIVEAFRKYASIPVINMESALYHPCQAMADMLTIRERFGKTEGVKVALSWAYHIKALPTSVANSFAVAAHQFGCDVTIVAPEGYVLPAAVMNQLGNVKLSHDLNELKKQDVVYAKSWGSLENYGVPAPESLKSWMIDLDKLGPATFMHCMPLRRNVEIADDVMDSGQNACYDQAENRLHVQKEIIRMVMG
ncbi:MAG: N-acetylornithine carbamoyltransferase [Blastocatellia bacterium]|nr:N-acetylornithine carbamoyltransferase [Blastocatellia bacterium]